jgi:hypothetical protein
VVNGMIALDIFGYLPNDELVEENQTFRNIAGAAFTPAPAWGLGSTASGRGMSMADLDQDGDLDIVINNLRSPAQLFENQLCTGHNLTLDLRDERQLNPYALGSQVIVHTSRGAMTRELRAASGYLSGDPAQLHFGFAPDTVLYDLEIHWLDGQRSVIDAPALDTHLTVTRRS